MLQGRIWGNRVLQDVLWCRHKGSRKLLLWVRGVRDRAGFRDRVLPLPPRRGAAPPRPLPPWAGRTGVGARQCGTGGQGSAWGRPTAAPLAAQGCGSPSADPRGGGILEPALHSASAVIGRGGGAQPSTAAPAATGSDGDLGTVAPRRIPHRMEAQVLLSRRDALGGQGGKGLNISVYSCI